MIFGMGERPVWELSERLKRGESIAQIRDLRGTGYRLGKGEWESIEASRFVTDRRPIVLPSCHAPPPANVWPPPSIEYHERSSACALATLTVVTSTKTPIASERITVFLHICCA